MLSILGAAARVLIGGKLLFDQTTQLYPEVQGIPLREDSCQEFIDTIAKTNGISNKILVRQDCGESPSWAEAYNLGDLSTRHPQIVVSKDRLTNANDLKFAIAHELGHLREHHGLIIQSILMANIALFALPIIPIKAALAAITFSAISIIPIFRCMEIRADNFAFANCPKDVIECAFTKDTPIPTGIGRIFGGNIEKRTAAIHAHSTS